MRHLHRSHRRVLAIAAAGALALVAVACGGFGTNSANQLISSSNVPSCPLGALRNATGTIHVSLWHGLGSQPKATLDALVKEFNAEQARSRNRYHIQIDSNVEGKSYDEVWDKYLRAAPTRDLPGIVQLEDTRLNALADSGTVLPAQSCMQTDGLDLSSVIPAVRNYWTVRGVFWPGNIQVSQPILYYNKAHFLRAGLDPNKPPQTLDELYNDAKKLKAAGISRPLSLVLDSWFLQSWLGGEGVDVVNNNNGRAAAATRATFDTPQARKLLQLFKKMQDEGLVATVAKTSGGIDQYLNVATQKSTMLISTSGAATSIGAFLNSSEDTLRAGNTNALVPGVGLFPGVHTPGKARVSGFGFFITSTTPPVVQAAAWEFLKFMSQRDAMVRWYTQGSYLPWVTAVASDPRVVQFESNDRIGKLLATAHQQLNLIDPRNPGPLIPDYATFQQAVEGAWQSIMFSGGSIDGALSSANNKVTAALVQYHADNG